MVSFQIILGGVWKKTNSFTGKRIQVQHIKTLWSCSIIMLERFILKIDSQPILWSEIFPERRDWGRKMLWATRQACSYIEATRCLFKRLMFGLIRKQERKQLWRDRKSTWYGTLNLISFYQSVRKKQLYSKEDTGATQHDWARVCQGNTEEG